MPPYRTALVTRLRSARLSQVTCTLATKRGGSGLGLALVAKLVGEHGGVIDVDSRPRRTVFRVMLPVINATESVE